jgi:hypothetical protein
MRQAEAIANKNMPSDLRRAGFEAYVFNGERGFVIRYGK